MVWDEMFFSLIFLLQLRFLELGSVLDPGKPLKVNKEAILSDATRMVIQLRDDAQKLKDSNESLQAKIEELKVRISFEFLLLT